VEEYTGVWYSGGSEFQYGGEVLRKVKDDFLAGMRPHVGFLGRDYLYVFVYASLNLTHKYHTRKISIEDHDIRIRIDVT